MNDQQKRLALIAGGLVALFVVALGVRSLLLKPLKDVDKKTAAVRGELEKVKAERRAYFAAEEVVKRYAQRSFADQLDRASAKSGEALTKQILVSGLREADFSRLPVGPRKLRGAQEIGWSVQGQGKLSDVVNLLFQLQESSYLHRMESLAVSAGDGPGQVRVGFRFLTLVMDSVPTVDPAALPGRLGPESPQRRAFDGLVARDLLRPYVKRSAGSAAPPSEGPTSPAGPAALRVVSLSEWMGAPEVHVRDLTNQKTTRYRLGDALAEGIIAMVDYRPLPMPGNEALKSFSRVIIRIGTEFWAVERGQTLADKRRLSPELLPEALAKTLNAKM